MAEPEPGLGHPRVLVIAPTRFNHRAGGGVTMSNLFEGWPKDQLAQLHSRQEGADASVCTQYFRLPHVSLPWATLEGEPLLHPRIGPLLRRARAYFLWPRGKQLLNALRWASQFNPDVIYTRPLDAPSIYWWLARRISQHLGVPYVTHIMDDWPLRYQTTWMRQGRSAWIGHVAQAIKRPRMARSLDLLFHDAAANLGISPEMGEAYQQRYGVSFIPFHNCIDTARWTPPLGFRRPPRDGRPIVVRYVGAVTADKELNSLRDTGRALRQLTEAGRPAKLVVHCAPAWDAFVDQELVQPPFVERGPFLSHDDLPRALWEADLLLLPINFDEVSQRYVGYSLQTKVPEYMTSGTPILAYGPPGSPNIRYARAGGWAAVVDQHDPDGAALAAVIADLLDNAEKADYLTRRAAELVRLNHEGAIVRERFRAMLANAAARQRP